MLPTSSIKHHRQHFAASIQGLDHHETQALASGNSHRIHAAMRGVIDWVRIANGTLNFYLTLRLIRFLEPDGSKSHYRSGCCSTSASRSSRSYRHINWRETCDRGR